MQRQKKSQHHILFRSHPVLQAHAAAVAIPRAVQEYPVAIQKLLASLYSDKAFIDALK
jgi:hypothetical protein